MKNLVLWFLATFLLPLPATAAYLRFIEVVSNIDQMRAYVYLELNDQKDEILSLKIRTLVKKDDYRENMEFHPTDGTLSDLVSKDGILVCERSKMRVMVLKAKEIDAKKGGVIQLEYLIRPSVFSGGVKGSLIFEVMKNNTGDFIARLDGSKESEAKVQFNYLSVKGNYVAGSLIGIKKIEPQWTDQMYPFAELKGKLTESEIEELTQAIDQAKDTKK